MKTSNKPKSKDMKKHYDILLQQHVTRSDEDDYATREYYGAENYRAAVRLAKKESLKVGSPETFEKFNKVGKEAIGIPLDEGLACVTICCWTDDSPIGYDVLWYEEYKHGKMICRY